jgi:hypothetical protein
LSDSPEQLFFWLRIYPTPKIIYRAIFPGARAAQAAHPQMPVDRIPANATVPAADDKSTT